MKKYSEAILDALKITLAKDPTTYLIGLGVPDPKGIFGTTMGLQEEFGETRVMDMPTSENGMTGIAIGSSLAGLKPIMTHQRADFALLALDQIINNAAKWHYMFDGKMNVPLVIRLIIGRGWGQGPQHSQNFAATFAHIPGLKVITPTTPSDVKGMLISAIEDQNPVISLEHRWLYNHFGPVQEGYYKIPLDQAKVVKKGSDITFVSYSYGVVETLKAALELEKIGINAEVIDLRSIKPIDEKTILESVKKTKKLLVFDLSWKTLGVSSEIIAIVCEKAFNDLDEAPIRINLEDNYAPTSHHLANKYYPLANDIIEKVAKLFNKKISLSKLIEDKSKKLDVPDKEFTGPF